MTTIPRTGQHLVVGVLALMIGCERSTSNTTAPTQGETRSADTTVAKMYQRVCTVGLAYAEAAKKLGRSPTTLTELEPFAQDKDALRSLRDGKPFELRAVENVDLGGTRDRLLVWEATADEKSERYVFQESQGGDRVSEAEFKALLDGTWTRERWLPRKKLFP
jgi:hypothetical protein